MSGRLLFAIGDYDPRPLDIWSCAIVLLTLTLSGSPWPAADVKYDTYSWFIQGWNRFLRDNPDRQVTETEYPRCKPFLTSRPDHPLQPAMRRLLIKMLHPNPAKRITVQGVLNDRHFKSIECCSPDLVDDPSKVVTSIDAAGKGSCKLAGKMLVQKMHHHQPPEKKMLLQRFDKFDED